MKKKNQESFSENLGNAWNLKEKTRALTTFAWERKKKKEKVSK